MERGWNFVVCFAALGYSRSREGRQGTDEENQRPQSHPGVGGGCVLCLLGLRSGIDRCGGGVWARRHTARHPAAGPQLRKCVANRGPQSFITSQVNVASSVGAAGVSITPIALLIAVLERLGRPGGASYRHPFGAGGGAARRLCQEAVGGDCVHGRRRCIGVRHGVLGDCRANGDRQRRVGHWWPGDRQRSRWPVLLFLMVVSLGAIYRVVGDRPRTAWLGVITPGSDRRCVCVVAGVGWLAFYAANFASYSKTYGTLASIVVVLLWFYLASGSQC